MSVHRQIGEGLVGVILRRERFARSSEVFEIVLRPPVGEATLSVELASLIVEAVADLVTDNGAHCAVVMSCVCGRIDVWRLPNAYGDDQLDVRAVGCYHTLFDAV